MQINELFASVKKCAFYSANNQSRYLKIQHSKGTESGFMISSSSSSSASCYKGDCKLPQALPVVGEVTYLLGRQLSIMISKEALDVLKIGCTLSSRPASAMCVGKYRAYRLAGSSSDLQSI